MPVKVGLVNIVALLSLVTLPNPTCVAVTPLTVPVKVGLANGAYPDILAPAGIVTVPVNVGLAMFAFSKSTSVNAN